jgi:hypothetical protein
MIPDWLKLDLPETGWEHPPAPPSTWQEHVTFVDEAAERVRASGKFVEMLGDFAELHRGEPFVMHD